MARVKVYDKYGTPEPLEFEADIENISFIDGESHGKGNEFGITATALRKGTKVLISSPNALAVTVSE